MARTRFSPSLVVACLALAVALGGTAWAATALPNNSKGGVRSCDMQPSGSSAREAGSGLAISHPSR
jgi:hypothetical protein